MQDRLPLTLRALDLQDAGEGDALMRVWRAAYELEAQWLSQSDFFPLQRNLPDLRAEGWQFVGAFVHDQLLGALATEDNRPKGELEIPALVVDPVHHGQGIATALLADLVTRADADRIVTQTAVANAAARTVYGRMGFLWHRPFTVGPDELRMVELRWHRRALRVDAPVTVRRLQSGEGQLLRALRLRSLRQAGAALATTDAGEWTRVDADWADLAGHYAASDAEACFVAEFGGRACGCVFAAAAAPENISGWWVDESQRGKGIGRELLAAARQWSALG